MGDKDWSYAFDKKADITETVWLEIDEAQRKDLKITVHAVTWTTSPEGCKEVAHAGIINTGADQTVRTFALKAAQRLTPAKEPGLLPMPDQKLADKVALAIVRLAEEVRAEGDRRLEQFLRDMEEMARPCAISGEQK